MRRTATCITVRLYFALARRTSTNRKVKSRCGVVVRIWGFNCNGYIWRISKIIDSLNNTAGVFCHIISNGSKYNISARSVKRGFIAGVVKSTCII